MSVEATSIFSLDEIVGAGFCESGGHEGLWSGVRGETGQGEERESEKLRGDLGDESHGLKESRTLS